MTFDKFLRFKPFTREPGICVRTRDMKKESFLISKVKQMSFTVADTHLFRYKREHNADPWIEVSYRRRGCNQTNLGTIELKAKFPDGVPISIKKYNDLLELTKYLAEAKRKYYKRLSCSAEKDAAEAERAVKNAVRKKEKV